MDELHGRNKYGRKPAAYAVIVTVMLAAAVFALSPATTSLGAGRTVLVATVDGVINPVTAEYVEKAVAAADEQDAEALVLKLDTPGGLDSSMRVIVKAIVGSRVPVITYVSPSGGRAASAGVFITMASHVAAMAPGTNIGAAHPVAMGGGKLEGAMDEKVVNDAAAYISSIAASHGRDSVWAEESVRKSVSISGEDALKKGVVEYVADDITSLLAAVDGRKVPTAYGERTLATKGAATAEFGMGARLKFLKVISDPDVAYILMIIGMIGVYFELSNPGLIFPGVVGGVALVLAFYSFQTLPVNYAGVLLILLAAVFFVVELHVASYGLLTLAALVSLVLGSVMLLDTPLPFMQISLKLILPLAVAMAVFAAVVARVAVRSHRARVTMGPEGLVGEEGQARTDIDPEGEVYIQGAYWGAYSDTPVKKGERVVVVSVEGLRLKVTRRY